MAHAKPKGFPLQSIGSQVDEKYLCSHCKLVLRNPVQSYCGHRFCRGCVESLINSGKEIQCQSCIVEHNEVHILKHEELFPDNATKRELYSRPAHCHNEGCTWSGNLRELEKHEGICEFRREECECGQLFKPEDFQTHLTNDCPLRIVTCQFCQEETQFQLMDAHLAVCERAPVKCDRCGETVVRMLLAAHMKSPECLPKVLCPYGCKQMVEEDKVNKHIEENVRSHFDAVLEMLEVFDKRLEGKLLQLQEKLQSISISGIPTDSNDTGAVGGSVAAGGIAKSDEAMDTNEGSELEHRLNVINTKINTFEGVAAVLVQSIREATGDNGMGVSMRALTSRVEQLEQQVRDREQPTSLTSLPEIPVPKDGVMIWKVTNFSAKRANASHTPAIYSEPFYTSPRGYKLCGRIYPDGDGVGRGSHLSVFLVIMQGPFDAVLRWPFRHRVTISLLDQSPQGANIVDAFRPDPSSSSFQRPVAEMNTASGCPMFASFDIILRPGGNKVYVHDDTFFIQYSVDTSKA